MGNDTTEHVESTESRDTSQELVDLGNEVQESQKPYKKAFSKLNFGYKTSETSDKWDKLKNKLSEKIKSKSDSIEWALINNPQVQSLLMNIISAQADVIEEERAQLREYILKHENEHDEEQIWDWDNQKFEDYKLSRLSIWQFEDFLLSDRWIYIIINELKRYINPETWEIYSNLQISEDALRLTLKNEWDSMILKEYHTGFDDALDTYICTICNRIGNNINLLALKHKINGLNNFDTELINNLDWLFSNAELLFSNPELSFSDSENEEPTDRRFRDKFGEELELRINNFSDFVYKDGRISLETWDNYLDLQLKSYLYIYGKLQFSGIFDDNKVKNWDYTSLTEILKIVLFKYNPELEAQIKNKKLLEQKKKADQERRERELRRRQEAERRNREKNNNLNRDKINWDRASNQDQDSSNAKDVSGKTLAKNVDLSDYSVSWDNMDSLSENAQVKDRALKLAWDEFIESNDEIKNIVTYADMLKLYNVDTNKIDEEARQSFLETDIMKWRSDGEIKHIYETLQLFWSHFSDAIKTVTSNIIDRRWEANDKIKVYALWSVIDNVKYIFDSIVAKWQWDSKFEWFAFNPYEPVKREWNDIIISWKFNWADIKVRYDLESGWLFMNSFIQHLSPSKITIWNNMDANYKIGQLESFDTILDEHYHSPSFSNNKSNSWNNWNRRFDSQDEWWDWDTADIQQLSDEQYAEWDVQNDGKPTSSDVVSQPQHKSTIQMTPNWTNMTREEIDTLKKRFWDMLNANIDLISSTVIDHTKGQSAINSVITKFMKTFNIMSDIGAYNGIDFNEWSNLFDLIQIIENTGDSKDGDVQSLEYFNNMFMPTIMEYSGLNWWIRNEYQNKESEKARKIFSYEGNNETINYFKNQTQNFNPDQFLWVANFWSSHQLWCADLIKGKFVVWSKPNRKLDIKKMSDFINELSGENK